jgi:hypothetical protein
MVLIFLGAQLLFAHHGAGTFDLSKTIQLQGKLTKVDLINPHSWLYFENTDPNGKLMRCRCEMRSAHVLRRSGWNMDLFPIGQTVNIEASPEGADPNSCYLQTIGREFFSGSTTPSARHKEASRFLLDRAATPPVQEGRFLINERT